MNISNGRIVGLSEYPDLEALARLELMSGGKCGTCRKNTIIRKYNAKALQRRIADAAAARVIPHKGAK